MVAGAQTVTVKQGPSGGGFVTMAFAPQKPGELRWYTWFRDASSYSKQNEMILNAQGGATVNSGLAGAAFGGVIKGIAGSDTWKINRSFDRADVIYMYKNDQPFSSNDPQAPNIDRIQATEDGILNMGNSMNSNTVAHFDYVTQKWRKNNFVGNNFIALRHNGLTYVTTFSGRIGDDSIRLLVQAPMTPTGTGGHLMTRLAALHHNVFGPLLHMTQYNDNVFAVFQGAQDPNRYAVYKINLSSRSIDLVHTPAASSAFSHSLSSAVLYNWSLVDVDETGNLYVVENRVVNTNGNYSIRRYSVSGGSEVILNEEDLQSSTVIHAIKFFAGKLHAAVVYKEDVPDGNPDDFRFTYNYHLQVLRPR